MKFIKALFPRFVELYGDITPKLGEEDRKLFDMWMENWIEQRQNDFYVSFGGAAVHEAWKSIQQQQS